MAGFENSSITNLNPHLNITSLDLKEDLIFRTSVLCFSILFGPPAHIYILWLIVTGKGIKLEFLNFQMSVSEIVICLNSFLMLLTVRFREFSASLSFAMGLTITGRPLFQCLICVERYLAVVHPVTFLKYKPLRYKLVCSAVAWFMALSSSLFSMFTGNTNVHVYRVGILLQSLVFFSVNIFCCLTVLKNLKKPGPGDREREREEENKQSAIFYLVFSQGLLFVDLSFLGFILSGFAQPVLYLHRVGKLHSMYFCWS